MNGLQLAKELSASTHVVGSLLNGGIIAATKKKGVWEIDLNSYRRFLKKEQRQDQETES